MSKDKAANDEGSAEKQSRGGKAEISRGKIDFLGMRKTGYLFSAIVLLIAVGSLFVNGLNLGIDFRGGSVYRYRFLEGSKATPEAIGDLLSTEDIQGYFGKVTIQTVDSDGESPEGSRDFLLFTQFKEHAASEDPVALKLEPRLKELGAIEQLAANEVGPTIGQTIQSNALKALLIAVGAMLLYVAFRFEFRWGVAGIVALVHDVTIVVGVFSIFRFQVTSDSLAALLTIIGYSLNDTIVIIDRVRENLEVQKIRKKLSFEGIFNLSINQSLSRTINTSLTTLIPVVCLLLLGGQVIRDFAVALLVGVIAGTYSSIFVVSALLVDWYYKDHPGKARSDRNKG